ncbi:MAG: HAMP domain-containing sensor histidine kinase [Tissierellia bacterium]|nr:HAMP domain-containing sensor histidine kinase [Tissierellia bacterium]
MKEKNKNSLNRALRNSFIYFTLAVLILIIVVNWFVNQMGQDIVDSMFPLENELSYADIVNGDNERIQAIQARGGMVKVLNRDFEVILPEQEDRRFTAEEIAQLSNGQYMEDGQAYFAKIVRMSDLPEESYQMILLPAQIIRLNYEMDMGLNVDTSALLLLLFSAGFILIVGYFFLLRFITRRINTQFTFPIADFNYDMKRVKEGSYQITHTEYDILEFDEMRTSFESMVAQLKMLSEKAKNDEYLRYQLITELGHDIKNSITPIVGYAGILKMDEDIRRENRFIIDKIIENCNGMEEMLRLLVSFGKLSRIDYKLNQTRLDIVDLFRVVIGEHYSSFETKRMRLTINIKDESLMLLADKLELKRAIINLVTNAVTHNPKETKVYMGLESDADEVRMIIADQGKPIAKEISNLIFEPFIREKPVTDKMGNSGLGLTISKKIIEKHGGKVDLIQPYREYTKAFVVTLHRN